MVSMEIKIIELTEDKAKLTFVGENHTYMNLLKEVIITNPDVDVVQYYSEYTFSDPILLVTTKNKKNPIDIIKAAAQQISKDCSSLLAQIEKA